MSLFKKMSLFLAIATALPGTGCATVPQVLEKINQQSEVTRVQEGWEAVPARVNIPVGKNAVIQSSKPVPDAIKAKKIVLGSMMHSTVGDLVTLLNVAGIQAMLDTSDDKLAERKIFLPEYTGTAGRLMGALENANDIAFEWRGDVVVVSPGMRYMVSLPQNEDVIKQVEAEIKALGATDIVGSIGSAMVSFRASPARLSMIQETIDRSIKNAAMVGLQVAVITVGLDRNIKTGIDWGKLQMTLGSISNPAQLLSDQITGANQLVQNIVNTGEGAGGEEAAIPKSSYNEAATGIAARLSGQNVMFGVREGHFSLQGLVNALSSYGDTRTTQNLMLRTLSGNVLKIRSGESVPYVSGISVNSTTNSDSLMGSAEVSKAETGITLEIDPSYDSRMDVVGMKIDIELSSNLGFVNLSAGTQVGSLTQPNIQEQSFNNFARIKAGETVVLGGIVYDSVTDNRNTLAGLESLKIASKDEVFKRSALLVVIRPSVTTYDFGFERVEDLLQDKEDEHAGQKD